MSSDQFSTQNWYSAVVGNVDDISVAFHASIHVDEVGWIACSSVVANICFNVLSKDTHSYNF